MHRARMSQSLRRTPSSLRGDDYRDILRACDRAQALVSSSEVLIVDTETTSLEGEIVQIAMIDTAGRVQFDTLVRPVQPVTPGSQRVHGITNERLRNAPSWPALEHEFRAKTADKLLLSYNAAFDSRMLANTYRVHRLLPPPLRWECVMLPYARYAHQRSPGRGLRWLPLDGGDHSALGDARATLALLQRMAGERERLLRIVQQLNRIPS
ncbi:MAG: 3'-5' exonuclease [Chloroflexi bacterium]|nr:3'-5' exonuclease [Chloroflexota bacterium]